MDTAPGPVRTCIGCRQRGPSVEMARLALVDGRVVAWRGRHPPGRGASLHAAQICVEKAVRSGAFARAFKCRVEGVEALQLLQQITAAHPRALVRKRT